MIEVDYSIFQVSWNHHQDYTVHCSLEYLHNGIGPRHYSCLQFSQHDNI